MWKSVARGDGTNVAASRGIARERYNGIVIWLAVALGGAIGAAARHGLNAALPLRYHTTFPWGTFAANAAGCFVIGLLAGAVATERLSLGETGRAFVFVGVLGGFTTFSSFGLDTLTLVKSGAFMPALANVAGQLVVGLGAVGIGYSLGAVRVG
jgi:CrcB protein